MRSVIPLITDRVTAEGSGTSVQQHRTTRAAMLLCLLLALFAVQSGGTGVQAQVTGDVPLDLVVVIDDSGSMKEPEFGESDPGGLRYDATAMLVDLVNDDDRIGVVQFARTATNRFGELRRVGDDRAGLKQTIAQIAAPEEQEQQDPSDTRYAPALQLAQDLLGTADPARKQAVILLTDGNPSDADASYAVLQQLKDRGITVFLLMLKPNFERIEDADRRQIVQRGIDDVLSYFRLQEHSVIEIASPIDIARAFATVLTQLQPGTYLDTLTGTAGSSGAPRTIYTVRLAPSQRLISADVIFVRERATEDLSVRAQQEPLDIDRQIAGSEGKYVVYSTQARSGSLNGEWQFIASVVPTEVTAFAFLRSDIRIRLRYPSEERTRAAVSGQNLLLGAEIDQLAPDAAGDVRLRVNLQRCPTMTSVQADDLPLPATQSSGLSATSTTLFWTTVSAPEQPLFVTVELAPAGSVALWRCYAIDVLETDPGALTIEADANNLRDQQLPVRIVVPDGTIWSKRLYLQSPDGTVTELEISDTGAALSGVLRQAGVHLVRAVAEGVVNGKRIALYGEQSIDVAGSLSVAETEFDLGSITTLDERLQTTLVITAPLLAKPTDLEFPPDQLQLIDASGRSIDLDQIELDLCSAGRQLMNGVLTCTVRLTPKRTLPAGEYRLSAGVISADQDIRFDRLVFRFERPPSGLQLNLPSDYLELPEILSELQPAVTYPVEARGLLYDGPPLLAEAVTVTEVRDGQQQIIDPGRFTARMIPVSTGNDGKYRISVASAADLAPDTYTLRLAFRAADGSAVFPPEATLVVQKRDVTVELRVEDPEMLLDQVNQVDRYWLDDVWTLWKWQLLPRTSSLPMLAEAQFALTFPENLPPLEVVSVQRRSDGSSAPLEWFAPSWQLKGAVPGAVQIQQFDLVMTLANPFIPQDDYEVLLRTPPGVITVPRELLVVVPVWPLTAIAYAASCSLAAFVVWKYVTSRALRGFDGSLEITRNSGVIASFALNGKQPHGLYFVSGTFVCRKISDQVGKGDEQVLTITSKNRREIQLLFTKTGRKIELIRGKRQMFGRIGFCYSARTGSRRQKP